MREDTYLDTAILLLWEVDLHHLVEVGVQVLLTPEALIQLLELIIS